MVCLRRSYLCTVRAITATPPTLQRRLTLMNIRSPGTNERLSLALTESSRLHFEIGFKKHLRLTRKFTANVASRDPTQGRHCGRRRDPPRSAHVMPKSYFGGGTLGNCYHAQSCRKRETALSGRLSTRKLAFLKHRHAASFSERNGRYCSESSKTPAFPQILAALVQVPGTYIQHCCPSVEWPLCQESAFTSSHEH